MPASAQVLIETTRTHRNRLGSALAYGELEERRTPNTNRLRVLGSIVVAAVICAVLVGTSFVMNLLSTQKEEQAVAAFRTALAANPLKPGGDWVQDEPTGFLRNKRTGVLVDPQTGYLVDRRTGLSKDPRGRLIARSEGETGPHAPDAALPEIARLERDGTHAITLTDGRSIVYAVR